MAADLLLHGRSVSTVFELLGTGENDITYSLGWALSRSPCLRQSLLTRLFPRARDLGVNAVWLQERDHRGITDIELVGDSVHVIIEAKRGWCVPSSGQLARYRGRCSDARQSAIVSMSECSQEFAAAALPATLNGVRVHHLSWNEVQAMCCVPVAKLNERRLLAEVRTYFQRIVKMQDQRSNIVYVVAVAAGAHPRSTLTWRQFVEKRLYFHPIGVKGWPKVPENYLGFRFGGRLQSIHHVEKCDAVNDLDRHIRGLSLGRLTHPHFLYRLGPPIRPQNEVRTGKLYRSGRVRAMLDLLLTCKTIAEARDRTVERLGKAE